MTGFLRGIVPHNRDENDELSEHSNEEARWTAVDGGHPTVTSSNWSPGRNRSHIKEMPGGSFSSFKKFY